MSAEEISAEILKSLTQDVLRKYPNFMTAAVITIPAAFSVLQCEATKRAGNLAGFNMLSCSKSLSLRRSLMVLPVQRMKTGWCMIWGTFDVALISSKDGVLSVLGHNGDNFLGGKNLGLGNCR